MRQSKCRLKIHFKNPKVRPIKVKVEGSLSTVRDVARSTIGYPNDEGRDLWLRTVRGKEFAVASNEILYIELEEA